MEYRLYDNEDVEGWLVDLGVGHFDKDGMFQEGIDLDDLDGDDSE